MLTMDLLKTVVTLRLPNTTSEPLLPESLAYYADEARGCTAEAVPTGDDDDAKIPGPSEPVCVGGDGPPSPDLADLLTHLNQGRGRLCPSHLLLSPLISTPSYGSEEQIDNDQDVGLVAK